MDAFEASVASGAAQNERPVLTPNKTFVIPYSKVVVDVRQPAAETRLFAQGPSGDFTKGEVKRVAELILGRRMDGAQP